MFDFVRTHSRLMLGLMVLLIFPSFVFFGIQGYSRFTDGAAANVAKVDGVGISRAEWDLAHQRQVEQTRRQNPAIDARVFDTPQARRHTLDTLVLERVLATAADKLHLTPTNDRLQRLFDSDPGLAALRNPDGRINADLVAAQGMSLAMFDQRMRQEFAVRQVVSGVQLTGFTPPSTAALSLDALLQRREIQYQRFDAVAYAGKVNPTDADLEAYYKANESKFATAEQASIEYVVLDIEALAKEQPVKEDELRQYYEQNAARFAVPEERRVSHILLKADKDLPAAEREKAKARAEALLAEVRKNPASFADLARKNSDDPGSKEQGGDLDFFGRGAMVKPFEDAAYALKPGEISNVIETDFGFHILHLTAVRGGDKKPFEAVRAEIETELRKQLAQKAFAEKAELFTNTVYEQHDSLQPVIDKLKLEKRTATVARTPAPGASGALASPRFLAALFGNDALRNKRNTDAVEVGPNQLASGRVVKHDPVRTLPLAEVKDRVRERVVASQAGALARKEGEALLARLKQNEAAPLTSTATVSRAQMQDLPRTVVDAVLRVDASKLPAPLGVDLGDAGFVVAQVTKVLPREPGPGGEVALQSQYAQAWSTAEAEAYLAALKKRYKAEIKESVVKEALSAASAATP